MTRIEKLIGALRDELQNYGEMLALLDQEQELALARSSAGLLQAVQAIQEQGVVVQNARRQRELCRRDVAEEHHLADEATFAELIKVLPHPYRPLITALVEENNELLLRVQRRARQNHLLLSRSVELMQKFMSTLFPARETVLYNPQGNATIRSRPARTLYEAIG